MTPSRRARTAAGAVPAAELLFCANCRVSVARAEIDPGEAARTPQGRVLCPLCTRSTPEERRRRRDLLETEFADDAPVPRPVEERRRSAPNGPPRTAAGRYEQPHEQPYEQPYERAAVLEARVGELERTVFRLQARIVRLEALSGRAPAEQPDGRRRS